MKTNKSLFDTYYNCIDNESLKRTQIPNIVLKENNRRYSLNNESKYFITKFKVEDCITAGEKGCEAILYVESVTKANNEVEYVGEKAFFIELKGCSVGHALKQLDNSFEKTKIALTGIKSFGRIVPSEYKRTKLLFAAEQKLILKFKQTGGNLIIKESLTDKV